MMPFNDYCLIPQSEAVTHKDVLDGIITGCQKEYITEGENGRPKKELGIDYVSMWYKLHKINSPFFGRYTRKLTREENKAVDCFNHMTSERAEVMADQILRDVWSHKRSIDAKSSETRMDKHNKQDSLIDTLADNSSRSTRIVSLKDDAKRGLKESILGIEKREAAGYEG